MFYPKFTSILASLLLFTTVCFGQSNQKSPTQIAKELNWGKFENHPAKSLFHEISWLTNSDAKLIALGLSNHEFDAEKYSQEFPKIFGEYNSFENEFEKRRALEQTKEKFFDAQGKAMDNDFFLTKTNTTLDKYSFEDEAFPDAALPGKSAYEQHHVRYTSLENYRDRNVFPRKIEVDPSRAERIVKEIPDDRIVEYYIIVKPIEGSSIFLDLNAKPLEANGVMTVIVASNTKEVIAVNPNPLTEFNLQPGKIGGYIDYTYNEESPKKVYIYPRKHELFFAEHWETGEDWKINSESTWFNWEKSGTYYIKGEKKEQKIYLTVNPNNVKY